MIHHIVILLLGTICASIGDEVTVIIPLDQTSTPDVILPPQVIPIYQLTYEISETKLDEFISMVVIYNPKDYDLNMEAYLNLLNITNKDLASLMKEVDYKHFLDVIGAKITHLALEVTKYFKDKTTTEAALQAVGINSTTYAIAAVLADEELMFQILKDADFSDEALARVYQISGLSLDGIMEIVKPVILEAMSKIDIYVVFKELKDEMEEVIDLVFSNITMEDALKNPLLTDIMYNYTRDFNLDSPLVIPIEPYRLVTTIHAVSTWRSSKNYMDANLVNIEDNSIIFRVRNVYTNGTYAVVEIDEVNSSYFDRNANDSKTSNDCLYITQSTDGAIETRNVTIIQMNTYLVEADNRYGDIPKSGAPLICDNLVCGIFEGEKDHNLYFIRLHDDIPEDWDDVTEDWDDDDDDSGVTVMSPSALAVIIGLVIFLFC